MGEERLTREEARKAKMQAALNVEFRATVARKYEMQCRREGIEPSLSGLIEFAYRHGLVRDIDINRFMTFERYPKALYDNNGCRSRAVSDLEDVIPVSDRKIFGWLTNLRSRYLRYRNGR